MFRSSQEKEMLRYLILSSVGLLMGIFTIITGGGAGAVYVAVLTIFFNISPSVATSTSLATMAPVAAVAAYLHAKDHNVNFKVGWIMLGFGACGALVGSACSGLIPDEHYSQLIGGIIIALSLMMFIKKRRKPLEAIEYVDAERGVRDVNVGSDDSCVNSASGEFDGDDCGDGEGRKNSRMLKAVVFGLLGGVISGMAGTSGTTAIIAGLTLLGASTMQTVGTSVFVMSGISLVGFLTCLGVGGIDWELTGLLVVSAIVGAAIGSVILRNIEATKNPVASKDSSTIDWLLIIGNLIMGVAMMLK